MADALNAVSADVAARKRGLLEAIATGGTAGLQAYEASEKSMLGTRQDGLDYAAQLAGVLGGPEAQGREKPFIAQSDRRLADLGDSRENFTQGMARMGTAHQNYMTQVSAAVPLVRANTDRYLAFERLEAEQKRAEKEAAKAEKDAEENSLESMSDSELGGYLYGAGTVERATSVSPAVNPLAQGPLAKGQTWASGKNADEHTKELGRGIGINQLLDPNRVLGLTRLTPAKPKPALTPADAKNVMTWAKTDEKTAKTIIASPRYKESRAHADTFLRAPLGDDGLVDHAEDGWADYEGMTPWEAYTEYLQATISGKFGRTMDALVNEFSPKFSALKLR